MEDFLFLVDGMGLGSINSKSLSQSSWLLFYESTQLRRPILSKIV
uniref:Uncharacterized protein n=1 Tax=Lepeophtheirus salmonis TaxID=72036 RepID=A0A0K2SY16_LEPSM